MTNPHSPDPVFPTRSSLRERVRIGELLRTETVGGILLVAMAAIAIVWANSPWAETYFALREFRIGYEPWHLELSLGAWAADGLLAIFFFLVGLELKREFLTGDLRDPKTAIVPVAAAAGGVAVPALIYVAITAHQPSLLVGWAIPTATDIAFAVAVLAIVGSHLPSPLRIFLLTLAVVDDLIAILIIAFFYTESIDLIALLIAVVLIAVYGVVAHRYRAVLGERPFAAWLTLIPLGVVAWAFVHASGIHATIAGVALAFMIPVKPSRTASPADEENLAEVFEHRFRPISAGLAVPVFAFFSAGVAFGGLDGLARAATDPVTIGIVAGLVLGKPIGILLTTRLVTAVTKARLDDAVKWVDLIGVGLLAGIGFTVSLLIGELSFAAGSQHADDVKIAILIASVVASLSAATLLLTRNRRYKRLEREVADDE